MKSLAPRSAWRHGFPIPGVIDVTLQNGEKKILSTLEEAIQAATIDTGALKDLGNARRFVSLCPEEPASGFDDPSLKESVRLTTIYRQIIYIGDDCTVILIL